MQKQRFEALSRICLNNWHYIDRKILSFHEGINFFTGHSGSGKSTVIDALQILLYANTDGRGFFNKAAADDSDRTLLEYLRGMVNIGDNNETSYLRNKNFSTTIVMELKRTDLEEYQSIGVVFDVTPSSNEISGKMFFWHRGRFFENDYRTENRAMTTEEVKSYLRQNYSKEEYYCGTSNERFRKQLYDVYLGGLNSTTFPQLFKRAIPFRMNIRLEDFVKEYICMEEDIHIEDMQESVMQYGRMRKRIADTCAEIEELKEIRAAHDAVLEKEKECRRHEYFMNVMETAKLEELVRQLQDRINNDKSDNKEQEKHLEIREREIEQLEEQSQELLKKIAASGYEEIKEQLRSVDELLEHLEKSRNHWERTAGALEKWKDVDITSNAIIWDIDCFKKQEIKEEELSRLQESLKSLREETAEQSKDLDRTIRELKKQEKELKEELKQLHQGKKAYPKELEEARRFISQRLYEKTGKAIPVEILADLLDIRDDTWRNAVEGYLGNNKLQLVVAPQYVKQAMEAYEQLDRKKYFRVAVLDTERVQKAVKEGTKEGSLAEEVLTKVPYARAYIDFQLGNVKKCEDVTGLRECTIGITRECLMYHSFRLQYINPDNYTRKAYIGEVSMRARIRQLENLREEINEKLLPLLEEHKECEKILEFESLSQPTEVYMGWKKEIDSFKRREKEKEKLEARLNELAGQDVGAWEREQKELTEQIRQKRQQRDELVKKITAKEGKIQETHEAWLRVSQEFTEKQRAFLQDEELEKQAKEYLRKEYFSQQRVPNYEKLRAYFFGKYNRACEEESERMTSLRQVRYQYLKNHPNRNFDAEKEDNSEYDRLLEKLSVEGLEELRARADEQAREAVELFRQDFIYKIRSAIKEALQKKDELNRIISGLNFGKDRYQFVIGKNKGPDGRYYDMFMNEDLEVNPSHLGDYMDHQMNLFSISHEERYGELMNELINVFIPPDNASAQELEEAKRNMERYADYRTYLSFDMQQIIEGEETIKIRLSKMLSKNSGGEGQNPLYIALLASFAQAYHIDLAQKTQRNPTMRLVVLDEAFSKMDGEKVASCIQLIRGLGFQAIISATNDKIQNYLESVDKTFVFANPNKKKISIQEFERKDFAGLTSGLEGE